MGSRDEDAALGVVRSTSVPIHDIGTAIYLSPDVFDWAAEWGWSNPFGFYFAGRGGMLGDVGADVVTSTFGWFEPNTVHSMYTEGVGVAPASEAAARMAEAHSKWGRKHYAEVENLEAIVAVTEELVDGLEGSAIPVFVGWRDAARCETPAGRAAQLMQILREWRGGLHLVATTAAGLSRSRPSSPTGERVRRSSSAGPSPTPTHCDQGQARRGRGDDRPPVCRVAGPGAECRKVCLLRGRGPGPSGRHPVAHAGPAGRGWAEPGTGYSEGLLHGRHEPRPLSMTAITATDLWCSSECTPPCQGGGIGFKSRQVRHQAPSRPGRRSPVTRSGSSVGRARA